MENVKFILASKSVTRRRLLESAGLAFDSFPPQIDEEEIKKSLEVFGAHPQEIATFLAEQKACLVSEKYPSPL